MEEFLDKSALSEKLGAPVGTDSNYVVLREADRRKLKAQKAEKGGG